MAQTKDELFGSNSTISGATITLDINDFVDADGNPLIADPATATPSQMLAAWISWLHRTNFYPVDDAGNNAIDNTQGIVSQSSFQGKTFEVRDGLTQIKNDFNFSVYTPDNASFDPDDVI